MQLTYTPMRAAHLAGAVSLSQAAGWPHRIEDWALILKISSGIVAMADDKLVATALATPFGSAAMANLIIVDESMRGRGLGRRILEAAMNTTDAHRWQLIATPDGLPLYKKLGFRAGGEIAQHQGVATDVVAFGGAVWGDVDDLAAIIQLDRAALQMDRASLYRELAPQARFAVLRENGAISGFAAVHEFGHGRVIGPVVARSSDDAKRLMSLAMSRYCGQFLRIDTETRFGFGPWLTQCGLAKTGGGLQMSTAPCAPEAGEKRYALASQALG